MKIQRISQYQRTLRFPNFKDYNSIYFSSFLDTDLGKIYSSIPLEELVNALSLKDKRKGPQSRFSPRGKLALMILKHYACCSDKKLIEQLNGNIDYQIFRADGIYANNINRRYVTQHSIKTDFKRKGKPSKHKSHFDQLAKMITKERASRLEGSFGTDKEHFLLNRIKARNQLTDRLWIFFGIHTSNALNIGRRIALKRAKA